MATDQAAMPSISIPAAADLSASQFRFVELSSGSVAQVNGAGDAAIGVLRNKPSAAGQAAEVGVWGVQKVVAGASFAVDAKLASDSQGRAVTAATGNHQLAFALEAAGAAGEIVKVLMLSLQIAP